MSKILVIDDEELTRFTICEMLQDNGYETVDVSSALEALNLLQTETFDAVITDIVMPEMDGNIFIQKALSDHPDLPIIAVTGGGRTMTHDYMEIAKASGARAVLEKPFSPITLFETLKGVL